eukprot:evm.model.scf_349.4 EVM.evm.TU.scf_349.4   scf_349:58086-62460(+)
MSRRLRDVGRVPEVALIEPPCLVAGEACSLDVHFSRDLQLREKLQVDLVRGGEAVGTVEMIQNGGNTLSLSLPAIKCWGIYLDLSPMAMGSIGQDEEEKSVAILALPREASQEVRRLFEMALLEIEVGGDQKTCFLPMGKTDLRHLDEQERRVAVWKSYFRTFCSDFASALDGLLSRSDHTPGRCASLSAYLLSQHMWHSASFLMTTCLRAGAVVTLGPFALAEEDLSAARLESGWCDVPHWDVEMGDWPPVAPPAERKALGSMDSQRHDREMHLEAVAAKLLDDGLLRIGWSRIGKMRPGLQNLEIRARRPEHRLGEIPD